MWPALYTTIIILTLFFRYSPGNLVEKICESSTFVYIFFWRTGWDLDWPTCWLLSTTWYAYEEKRYIYIIRAWTCMVLLGYFTMHYLMTLHCLLTGRPDYYINGNFRIIVKLSQLGRLCESATYSSAFLVSQKYFGRIFEHTLEVYLVFRSANR